MKRPPTADEFPDNINKIYDDIEETTKDLTLKNHIDIRDPFKLSDIRKKKYVDKLGNFQIINLINDLSRVFAYIEQIPAYFMYKEYNEIKGKGFFTIKKITKNQAMEYLETIEFIIREGKNKIKITAWSVLKSNLKCFSYNYVTFISDNEDNFSIFQGFPFKELPDYDPKIIQPFLYHTMNVICNRNQELFRYVMNWLFFIFQNPGKKSGIAIVLVGAQGAGKNIWTNCICTLLGDYANPNASLNNIVGSFNVGIIDKILIIVNELGTYEEMTNDKTNKLKTIITETKIDINSKHKNSYSYDNVANFIFISNNRCPLYIDRQDRRYLVIEVSDQKLEDTQYFKQLEKAFGTKEFIVNLLTYFRKEKISTNFELTKIPMTAAKREIIKVSTGGIFEFIKENVELFNKQISRDEIHTAYIDWARRNYIKPIKNYRNELLNYCNESYPTIKGIRKKIYVLKNKYREIITKEKEDRQKLPQIEVPKEEEEEAEETLPLKLQFTLYPEKEEEEETAEAKFIGIPEEEEIEEIAEAQFTLFPEEEEDEDDYIYKPHFL